MAGVVFVSDEHAWAVDSWTFGWAITTLAGMVVTPALADRLREVDEQHLGSIALADLRADERADLAAQVARLPHVAASTLPPSDGRDAVVASVTHLAELVAAADV